ncbi:MAG TPA: DUF4190 domain-containing protein, partial [Acidimicrobiales bacterium]|nr:DUF4190 domain-containing protein [Acidimicrobiales bacterium]
MPEASRGIRWATGDVLVVRERGHRGTLAFGKICLGALPALYLIQADARPIIVIPVAALGLTYGVVGLVRSLRMELRVSPEGVRIRDAKTTLDLAWHEVDSFTDAFVRGNQGPQWALGVKCKSGSVVVAQATACGKNKGRSETVDALRAAAFRFGVGADLTGIPGNGDLPIGAGWHQDPSGKDGLRYFNGAAWTSIRQFDDAHTGLPLQCWDPIGDATAERLAMEAKWRSRLRYRNIWIAAAVALGVGAIALWSYENHPGRSFTLSAVLFFATAGCVYVLWNFEKRAQEMNRMRLIADSPVPVPAGVSARSKGQTPRAGSRIKRDRLAAWSLVCSIAGCVTLVLGLVGIVLGTLARRRLVRDIGRPEDIKLATAGIVVGALSIVVFFGGLLLIGLASPPSESPAVALAHQALMTSSDYPHGWQDQGAGSGTYNASFFNALPRPEARQLASCIGASPIDVDIVPTEVAGDEFDAPVESVLATDTIDVFPSAADAGVDVGAAKAAKGAACDQVQLVNNQWPLGQAQWYFTNKTTAGILTITPRQLPALG